MDLHVHSCLSPCGDSNMVPTQMVRRAQQENLDILGICDHNSSENVNAVKIAGKREGLSVIGGIEISSREEAHILAIFGDSELLMAMQNIIYENMSGENDDDAFGEQLVVDEYDEVIGSNQRLLIGATDLSVEEIVNTIHRLDGIAIASHIDKEVFSITSQLGFIPNSVAFDALELSPHYRQKLVLEQYEDKVSVTSGFPVVSFSDAHYLNDIGKSATYFSMENTSIEEIKKALFGIDKRTMRL